MPVPRLALRLEPLDARDLPSFVATGLDPATGPAAGGTAVTATGTDLPGYAPVAVPGLAQHATARITDRDGGQVVGTFYPTFLGDPTVGRGAFVSDGTTTTVLAPPAGVTDITPTGISGGVIAGYYYTYTPDGTGNSVAVGHGFVLDGGTYTILDAPGGTSTLAAAIDGDAVVGTYQTADLRTHGFRYRRAAAAFETLDAPGATYTYPTGVSGETVVGYSADGAGTDTGFVFDGTTYTTVVDPDGGGMTRLSGIEGGMVVGTSDYVNARESTFFVTNVGGSAFTHVDFGTSPAFSSWGIGDLGVSDGTIFGVMTGSFHMISAANNFTYAVPAVTFGPTPAPVTAVLDSQLNSLLPDRITATAPPGVGGTTVEVAVAGTPAGSFAYQRPPVRQTAVGTAVGTVRLLGPDGSAGAVLTPFPGFAGEVRPAIDSAGRVVAGTGRGAAGVAVVDPATGAVAFAATPFEAGFTGGVFVSAGDLFGTGSDQVVVSAGDGGGPRVKVLDPATGAVLLDFFGIADPAFRGGANTAVGDVTGDGVPDLIVAAGEGGGPRVTVWDGASIRAGSPAAVADVFAFEDTLRSGVYVAAGDVNGDGAADLAFGGGPGAGPRVRVVSGRDLNAGLADFLISDAAARGGVRVAVRDVDGDGAADLLTAAAAGVTAYNGRAALAGGTPPTLFTYTDANLGPGGPFVG